MRNKIIILAVALFGCGQTSNTPETGQLPMNFHQLKAVDIHGETYDMAQLAGHKVLVVNTASECGYTPQYEQLQELYDRYKDKGLVVIGFPSNDFGSQEPGDEEAIATFCKKYYGITFPMMSKVHTKGEGQSPVYAWLTQEKLNGVMDSEVKWNFQKYLIDEEGRLVDMLPSAVEPFDPRILQWLGGK